MTKVRSYINRQNALIRRLHEELTNMKHANKTLHTENQKLREQHNMTRQVEVNHGGNTSWWSRSLSSATSRFKGKYK